MAKAAQQQATEQDKKPKQRRMSKREEWERRKQYKLERAQRDDTTVVPRTQTPIGHSLYSIASQLDRCVAQLCLSSGQIGGVSISVSQEIIAEINVTLLQLDELAAKVSQHTRFKYKSPSGFAKMREELAAINQ